MPVTSDATIKTAARDFSAFARSTGFTPEALHTYTNADGTPCYWKLRMRHPGTQEKWIRPMSMEKDNFVLKEPEFSGGKPLYGLDLLAQRPDDLVVICEGESCADALRKYGVLAVTSGGAKSAEATDWQPVAGRNVWIWPDHDQAGFGYGSTVAGILRESHCQVTVIDTTALEMGEKEDAVEWLQRNPNVTAEDIFSLPVIGPSSEPSPTGLATRSMELAPAVTTSMDSTSFRYDGGEFCLSEEGLYYFREGAATRRLCGWLRVEAATRDESSGEWGRMLSFVDADSVKHEMYVAAESLVGDGLDLLKSLARLGLWMSAGRASRDLILAYIQMCPVEGRVRTVDRLGWHGDIYVTAEGAVGPNDERVICRSVNSSGFSSSGTVEEWRESVGWLARGNSRLVFSISCALAGPLLDPAGEESGGFNLRGPSSLGKTTALQAGASVWGNPFAIIQQWRATTNGLEGVAAIYSDCTLFLDELSQADPIQAGEAAYMLGNGRGKARAMRTGAARPVTTWRILFLSSGEVSLSDLQARVGKRPQVGQEVRIADFEADTGSGLGAFEDLNSCESAAALADAVKKVAYEFYGTVGKEWLQQLVTDRPKLHTLIHQGVKSFVNEAVQIGRAHV